MSYEKYQAIGYTDDQKAELPYALPLPSMLFIHNAVCLADPRGSWRVVASTDQIRQRLDKYAQQTGDPATYTGRVCIDYEVHTGQDGPGGKTPIQADELERLLVTCVHRFRAVLPSARLSIWAHPSAYRFGDQGPVPIEPFQLTRLWDIVDFVLYHDYTNQDLWGPAQRDLSAARIAAAHETGLEVIQGVYPRKHPAGGWIPSYDFMQRICQAKTMGAAGVVYWDGLALAAKEGPDYADRWAANLSAIYRI